MGWKKFAAGGVLGLLKPEKEHVPPPPPPPELREWRDELFGTQRVEVKGPDGKPRIVQRSNLSAEDQARINNLKQLAASSMSTIQKLQSSGLAIDNPEFGKMIDAFQSAQYNMLDENFAKSSDRQEEILAQRGIESSTAGTEARQAMFRAKMQQKQGIADKSIEFAENLRDRELGRQQGFYSLAQQGIQQSRSEQFNSLNMGTGLQQMGLQIDNQTRNEKMQYEAAKAAAEKAQRDGFMNNIFNVASIAAAPFTGGASLAALGKNPFGGGGAGGVRGAGVTQIGGGGSGWASYSLS